MDTPDARWRLGCCQATRQDTLQTDWTLTVALSSTLMEYGSATLCLRSACSNCWSGGLSHLPKTTKSMSLQNTNRSVNDIRPAHYILFLGNLVQLVTTCLIYIQNDKLPASAGTQHRSFWIKHFNIWFYLVGRYKPVLKLPKICTWERKRHNIEQDRIY